MIESTQQDDQASGVTIKQCGYDQAEMITDKKNRHLKNGEGNGVQDARSKDWVYGNVHGVISFKELFRQTLICDFKKHYSRQSVHIMVLGCGDIYIYIYMGSHIYIYTF